ncbi:MAG: hypothetical protein JNM93_06185 [Bacteriovoracaceae bacterium]|nr:hypothetical protein [Bacteriovoracaceae bacterium]
MKKYLLIATLKTILLTMSALAAESNECFISRNLGHLLYCDELGNPVLDSHKLGLPSEFDNLSWADAGGYALSGQAIRFIQKLNSININNGVFAFNPVYVGVYQDANLVGINVEKARYRVRNNFIDLISKKYILNGECSSGFSLLKDTTSFYGLDWSNSDCHGFDLHLPGFINGLGTLIVPQEPTPIFVRDSVDFFDEYEHKINVNNRIIFSEKQKLELEAKVIFADDRNNLDFTLNRLSVYGISVNPKRASFDLYRPYNQELVKIYFWDCITLTDGSKIRELIFEFRKTSIGSNLVEKSRSDWQCSNEN